MSSISPGPASPTPSFVLKNITIDDTDSSLKYSQGWNRSVSSPAFGGSFQSTDRIGEVVSFSLPANAVALYYIGFKQSSGALYEACLDCSTKNSNNVDVIDGHTDGRPSSEPTLLYQKTNLDPSVRHSLALLNVPDSRFGNTSTITVDAFLVTVADDVQSSTTTTTSMMSSMSGMSLMAMNPASDIQDVPSSTSPPDIQVAPLTSIPYPSSTASMNTASQNQNDLSPGQRTAQKMRSPLVITGVILGTLFIVFTALFALMYFMRRRKRKMTAPVMTEGHWAARFFGD
ncbi:uncharacterized protein FOMMEDRAFT_23510, partial [Fomitiporia mediterranea MF3/22]|uniref:uncharacterized protein n=1 Tax=Fomitiporia mediterranea (strain MF3/22) TaxID=694068 RepID=UPI00044074D7